MVETMEERATAAPDAMPVESCYDPIRELLETLRVRVKVTDLGALALVCLAGVALYLFAAAVGDRFLVLDKSARFTFFWVWLGLLGASVATLIYYGLWRVNELYIAQLVQRQNPELHDMLIAQVSAEHGMAEVHPALYDALFIRLQECAPAIRSSGVVPRKWLLIATYVLAAVTLFFVSSAAMSEGSFWTCLKRVVMPWSNILPPTRTQIAEVMPGNASGEVGTTVEIMARTQGERPDSVRLVFYRAGGSYHMFMQADAEPANRGGNTGMVWRARLSYSGDNLTYYIAANDTKSDSFTLEGILPPVVRNITAIVRYPEYTGLGEKEFSGGHVDALDGSTVRVRATISKPIRDGRLLLSWGQERVMEVSAEQASVIESGFTLKQSGTYRVDMLDTDGLKCRAPGDYDIRARVDGPPVVSILEPEKLRILEHDERFQLMVSAKDDYGLCSLTLVYHIRNGGEKRVSLGRFPSRRDVLRQMSYTLDELEFLPGDDVYYYVEAEDGFQPQPHRATTDLYRLHIKPRPWTRNMVTKGRWTSDTGLKERRRGFM